MQLFSAGLTKPSLNGIKKAMKCFVNNYPSQNLYYILFRIGKRGLLACFEDGFSCTIVKKSPGQNIRQL